MIDFSLLSQNVVLLKADLGFKFVLALLLLDVVHDGLCEGFVAHEVLALVQAVVGVRGGEELLLLVHVRDVRVDAAAGLGGSGCLVPGRLVSLLHPLLGSVWLILVEAVIGHGQGTEPLDISIVALEVLRALVYALWKLVFVLILSCDDLTMGLDIVAALLAVMAVLGRVINAASINRFV